MSAIPFKAGNVLLCEEVRSEINGKHTILGTLPGDVLVAQFPGNIRISAYIELYATQIGDQSVEVQLNYRGMMRIKGDAKLNVQDIRNPGVIAFPAISMDIDKPGSITIDIIQGAHRRRILTKKVRLNPDAASLATS